MASILKVDKLDPQSGTALEIGTSGDTVTVPSGATLDISSATLTPPATLPASSGVNLTALNATNLGSGTLPDARFGTLPAVSGVNLTALNASNLGSGTVPTARLGSGTASSTTVLYGDQTYKAEPSGAWTLIDSTDISSATGDWTASSLSDTYRTYFLSWWISPTAGNVGLQCEINGATGTYDMIGYLYETDSSGSAAITRQHGEDYWEFSDNTVSQLDDEGIGGHAIFETDDRTNASAYCQYNVMWTQEGAVHDKASICSGVRRDNAIIDAIKLAFHYGNISHGWVRLLGRT